MAEVSPLGLGFSKIKITQISSGKKALSDIYLKLSDTKFVKILHQQAQFPATDYRKLIEKNIQYLYIKNEDLNLYIGLKIIEPPSFNFSEGADISIKDDIVNQADYLFESAVYLKDLKESDILESRGIVDNSLSVLLDYKNICELFDFLRTKLNEEFQSVLKVSLLACLLARHAKWNSSRNLYKVAIGGLFRKFPRREVGYFIIEKFRNKLSGETISFIEEKPQVGLSYILKQIGLNNEILDIISSRVYEPKIEVVNERDEPFHPLSRPIDQAVRVIPYLKQSIKLSEAIHSLPFDSQEDPAFLKALMQIGNVSIPRHLEKYNLD